MKKNRTNRKSREQKQKQRWPSSWMGKEDKTRKEKAKNKDKNRREEKEQEQSLLFSLQFLFQAALRENERKRRKKCECANNRFICHGRKEEDRATKKEIEKEEEGDAVSAEPQWKEQKVWNESPKRQTRKGRMGQKRKSESPRYLLSTITSSVLTLAFSSLTALSATRSAFFLTDSWHVREKTWKEKSKSKRETQRYRHVSPLLPVPFQSSYPCFFIADGPFCDSICLVSHQQLARILTRIAIHLAQPLLHVLKWKLTQKGESQTRGSKEENKQTKR